MCGHEHMKQIDRSPRLRLNSAHTRASALGTAALLHCHQKCFHDSAWDVWGGEGNDQTLNRPQGWVEVLDKWILGNDPRGRTSG